MGASAKKFKSQTESIAKYLNEIIHFGEKLVLLPSTIEFKRFKKKTLCVLLEFIPENFHFPEGIKNKKLSSCINKYNNKYYYEPKSFSTNEILNKTLFYPYLCYITNICYLNINYTRLLIAVSDGELLKIWDLISGNCLNNLSGHNSKITCVIKLNNSLIASSSESIKIWDFYTGRCLNTISDDSEFLCIVKMNNKNIISGTMNIIGGLIQLWDFRTGECLKKVICPNYPLQSIEKLSNTQIAILREQNFNFIQIFDLKANNWYDGIKTYKGKTGNDEILSIKKVLYLNKFNFASITKHYYKISIWDYITGKIIKSLGEDTNNVVHCVIKINKNQIAGGYSNTIIIWDFHSGNCIKTLTNPSTSCFTKYERLCSSIDCIIKLNGAQLLSGSVFRTHYLYNKEWTPKNPERPIKIWEYK